MSGGSSPGTCWLAWAVSSGEMFTLQVNSPTDNAIKTPPSSLCYTPSSPLQDKCCPVPSSLLPTSWSLGMSPASSVRAALFCQSQPHLDCSCIHILISDLTSVSQTFNSLEFHYAFEETIYRGGK